MVVKVSELSLTRFHFTINFNNVTTDADMLSCGYLIVVFLITNFGNVFLGTLIKV